MTTIAYKDGIIAYDGRVSRGNTIVYDDFDKMREREGVCFFGTGSTGDINELVGAWFGEEFVGECDANALVLHDGSLTLIGYDEGKVWKSPVVLDRPYAIGSALITL